MLIDQKTMDRIHDVQYEMLKELIRVMDLLHIKYYFVHGSLLGAIRDHDFIAEDDDIDIALLREDYNTLMYYGQALLSSGFFLQNSTKDGFPLAFGKLRKNNTAFIQPVLKNIDCHKGIYIDIFPLDYENKGLLFRAKKFFLDKRIQRQLDVGRKNWKLRILEFISCCFCVYYSRALLKREVLYSLAEKSPFLTIYGGKSSEKHMPAEWFSEQTFFLFRDIVVGCPSGYDAYLKHIYGENYIFRNPAETRIEGRKIEISAEILDLTKSYLDYPST